MEWPLAAVAAVVAIALSGWWFDSLRARERAQAACAEACARIGVQLLDETVALAKLRLARDRSHAWVLARTYVFEFSLEGNDRYSGHMTMLGRAVEVMSLDQPSGVVLLHPAAYRAYR